MRLFFIAGVGCILQEYDFYQQTGGEPCGMPMHSGRFSVLCL